LPVVFCGLVSVKGGVAMKASSVVKIVLFLLVLVGAHVLFGLTCNRFQNQYEVLFTQGKPLLDLALWTFGSILLVALMGGLVAALVRPFWVVALGFFLSALALVLAWGFNLYSGVATLVYLLIAILFANDIIHEMKNQLAFSTRPIQVEQKLLLLGLALLVGAGFALGYRAEIEQSGLFIPAAYKQTIITVITRSVKSQLESQAGLGAAEVDMALQQLQQGTEKFWTEFERMLKPYAPYLPFVLGALVFWMLETLLGFVAWIPSLLLSGIIPLLKAVGVTHEVVETREARRLVLE